MLRVWQIASACQHLLNEYGFWSAYRGHGHAQYRHEEFLVLWLSDPQDLTLQSLKKEILRFILILEAEIAPLAVRLFSGMQMKSTVCQNCVQHS
jgi:hypothetical protein